MNEQRLVILEVELARIKEREKQEEAVHSGYIERLVRLLRLCDAGIIKSRKGFLGGKCPECSGGLKKIHTATGWLNHWVCRKCDYEFVSAYGFPD